LSDFYVEELVDPCTVLITTSVKLRVSYPHHNVFFPYYWRMKEERKQRYPQKEHIVETKWKNERKGKKRDKSPKP
jgi:hypothetical protein